MHTNKENKIKYFLGGSAIGIAAGFLIGNIIKNTSVVQAQTSRTEVINNEKIIKYSQDDNIHNLNHLNNVHSGRVRSKSSSQYENVDWENKSKVFNTSSTKLNNSLTNNMNNLTLKEESNKIKQKNFYSNTTIFCNTSIEDNADIEYSSKVIKRSNRCTSVELNDILNSSFNDDLHIFSIDENVSKNNINNSNHTNVSTTNP